MVKKILNYLKQCGLTEEDLLHLPSNHLHQMKTNLKKKHGLPYEETTKVIGVLIDRQLTPKSAPTPKPGDLAKAIESVHSGGVSGFCKRWGMEEDALKLWDRNPQQWHNVMLLGIFATVDPDDGDNIGKCPACGHSTTAILVDADSRVMECVNQIDCGHIIRIDKDTDPNDL